ncbi:MAG: helix-turn-helix domain-containing protein [Bryobacterales bacterium]|nr:helix-turn-helix domain-containing protein [Bryobacterales bacterium]
MAKDRKPSQVARDRRKIADLYLRGKVQQEIAKELDLSQATVSRDLKAIQEDWVREAAQALDRRKAIELAKVDALELEYWEAWKRSQADAISETSELSSDSGGQKMKKQKRVDGQVGDPRFLAGVMQCIDRRCQILGIDAPKKTDVTSGGQPLGQVVDEVQHNRAIHSLAETLREIVS